ncbi:MAG: AraC family transcriptional regulator [Clostridia bacterium]|nr:AraC family transcriptional regulator [Clostridia bacterium]
MKSSEIHPFIRYAHYIPMGADASYQCTIPYDHRFFYLYDGAAAIQTDQERYLLDAGDVLIIPSGNRYQLLPPESKAVYIALNFDYTQSNTKLQKPIPPVEADTFDDHLILEKTEKFNIPIFHEVTYISGMKNFSSRLSRIEQEYSQKLLYFEEVISNILAEILWECARAQHGQKYKGSKEITSIVTGYINENLSRPLSNKTIGEALKLHPNYISKLIKISTGLPLHQYLLRTRVYHSIELLTEKKHTVSEIAELCGFCDIYHYSKSFKKIMGIPPSEYLS